MRSVSFSALITLFALCSGPTSAARGHGLHGGLSPLMQPALGQFIGARWLPQVRLRAWTAVQLREHRRLSGEHDRVLLPLDRGLAVDLHWMLDPGAAEVPRDGEPPDEPWPLEPWPLEPWPGDAPLFDRFGDPLHDDIKPDWPAETSAEPRPERASPVDEVGPSGAVGGLSPTATHRRIGRIHRAQRRLAAARTPLAVRRARLDVREARALARLVGLSARVTEGAR